MATSLSPGRWRSLKMTNTAADIFAILTLTSAAATVRCCPADMSYEEAVSIKREVVVTLTQKTSAVLLDNQYGLSVMEMRGGCGLLMSYERLQRRCDLSQADFR